MSWSRHAIIDEGVEFLDSFFSGGLPVVHDLNTDIFIEVRRQPEEGVKRIACTVESAFGENMFAVSVSPLVGYRVDDANRIFSGFVRFSEEATVIGQPL